MVSDEFDSQEGRRILQVLSENGPMSHEELATEIGHDWDQIQTTIRGLRNEGLVSITLDRRYEAEESDFAVTA